MVEVVESNILLFTISTIYVMVNITLHYKYNKRNVFCIIWDDLYFTKSYNSIQYLNSKELFYMSMKNADRKILMFRYKYHQ